MLHSGKGALLQWAQQQTAGICSIDNFNTSWRDGVALCAIVESIWPQSLDIGSLPASPEQKLEAGLQVAVNNGISRLVEPFEFASDEIEAPSSRMSKQQQRQSQFISHIQYCSRCNNPLSLINVECGGKHYHTDCFTCSLCENKITNSCVIIGGNPFCTPCGKKSFKMATWKLHKKQKERWWLDLWRTSGCQFPGLTKDGATSHFSSNEEYTDVGDDIDDDIFYSDEEDESPPSPASPARNHTVPSTPPSPSPPPPSIDYDDVLLDQIKDEDEKRAFIELFPRLPEPEPTAVQLQLTATPVSSSPLTGQPSRGRSFQHANSSQSSLLSSSAPQSQDDVGMRHKNRAHRSAMFINPSALPKESPSSPSASSTSASSSSSSPSPSTSTSTSTSTSSPSSSNPTSSLARPRTMQQKKPMPTLPSTNLTSLSTRSTVSSAVSQYPQQQQQQQQEDETNSSNSSSPLSSPRDESSPRDSARDSLISNLSVSDISEPITPQTKRRLPLTPAEDAERIERFSRMFAASVSRLLSSQDKEEVEDPPIREGFLIKKMDLGVVRPWQRRYFLLKRDQLLYFVNKESRLKGLTLGIIPLNSVSQINPISPAKWCRFQLVGENGMYWYLQANTRVEMESWLLALRKACHVRNEAKLRELSTTAGLSMNSLQKKEGSVEVRHKTAWVTRWIVLKDGILWEYSAKDGPLKAKIALYKSQLNEYQPATGLIGQLIDRTNHNPNANTHSFQITSPTRSIIIRTNSAEQMHGWLNSILKQKVIVEEIIETVALEAD